MKKSDIKDLKPINMSEGIKYVSIEKLHESGKTVGFKFTEGDEVIIPDMDEIQIAPDSFKNKAGEVVTYLKIKVGLNDICKLIPVAAFRQNKDAVEQFDADYCSQCEIARLLRTATDDFERMQILAGKTLKVVNLFHGRNKKYGIAYDPEDRTSYSVLDWPIFKVVMG